MVFRECYTFFCRKKPSPLDAYIDIKPVIPSTSQNTSIQRQKLPISLSDYSLENACFQPEMKRFDGVVDLTAFIDENYNGLMKGCLTSSCMTASCSSSVNLKNTDYSQKNRPCIMMRLETVIESALEMNMNDTKKKKKEKVESEKEDTKIEMTEECHRKP